MKDIFNAVAGFKQINPNCSDLEMMTHLKSLGFTEDEIREFYQENPEKTFDLAEAEMVADEPEAIPDFNPFDLPDDIKGELGIN